MQTLFREAGSGDIEAVLLLWHEMMEFHANLDPRYRLVSDAAIQVEAHLRLELDEPTSLLAVAEHDSVVVAYCRASIRRKSPIFERRVHGFVSEFHVLRSMRRRGIGRGLFQFVRQWFGEQGISSVELVTLDANEGSNAFWQSVGCIPYARSLTTPPAAP